MGEILVDMGFLKARELFPAVRRHIEDIIYSLFAWTEGDFAVIASSAVPGQKGTENGALESAAAGGMICE